MTPGRVLLTIDYEDRSLDELVADLVAASVTVLVDARTRAPSRKPGMSKPRLATALGSAGIEYRHWRELGNPKENRDAVRHGAEDAGGLLRNRLGAEPAASTLRGAWSPKTLSVSTPT